jgi:hypothetical protein
MNRRRTDAPAPSVEELRAYLYAEHTDLRNRHSDFLGLDAEDLREFLRVQMRVANEFRHNLLVSLSECAQ